MSQPIDWTKVDWDDLNARLLLYAVSRLRQLIWRGSPSEPILGGMTSADFVYEAIKKTISGERVWNQRISLFNHLAGVISSDISHLADSAENRRSLPLDDEKIVQIAARMESPEASAIRKSQEKRFFSYLEEKKPALRKLAEAILCGLGITEELARELDDPDCKLESLKRELRRATQDFLKEEEEPTPPSSLATVVVKKN